MRVGVLADTHVGEHLPALPDEVLRALDGVDLILHAGDISVPAVLDRLRAIAPVVAVRGNHDRRVRGLPRDMVVRVGAHRIGLTHGTRSWVVQYPAMLLSLITRRPVLLGFGRHMVRRFIDVDLVVTGHLHLPTDQVVDGVRHWSPGAVHVPEAETGDTRRRGLRAAAYRRFRSALPASARVPSFGMLEVTDAGITVRTLTLPHRAGRTAAAR